MNHSISPVQSLVKSLGMITPDNPAGALQPVSQMESLNGDCHMGLLDRAALQREMQAQDESWYGLVMATCPYLFADVAVFISAAHLKLMQDVIEAVERVVKLDGWKRATHLPELTPDGAATLAGPAKNCQGVFFGYDFNLNAQGAHLIEINTNAGGGFLNALLLDSQRDVDLPGQAFVPKNLSQAFLDMFRSEWRWVRGDAPLKTIAIVDEQPETQYLHPEFLLAKKMFERAGIAVCIVDPSALLARDDGLYHHFPGSSPDEPGGIAKIDLIYNRLTDFYLNNYPALHHAYLAGQVVLTPHPHAYAQYADKRNLARLTNAQSLRALGVNEADIAVLQTGVPHTIVVQPHMEHALWQERQSLFFKPGNGYGGKGSYRGANLTRRVFGEIMQGDYVGQKFAAPGERRVCVSDAEPAALKYDVRCYVYDGKIQLVAARLYKGQTTNFRTQGSGFAQVRVVE